MSLFPASGSEESRMNGLRSVSRLYVSSPRTRFVFKKESLNRSALSSYLASSPPVPTQRLPCHCHRQQGIPVFPSKVRTSLHIRSIISSSDFSRLIFLSRASLASSVLAQVRSFPSPKENDESFDQNAYGCYHEAGQGKKVIGSFTCLSSPPTWPQIR